ncbi:hypothetical protein GCM10027059_26920 [Myceligenerans halotolerans]
MNALIEEGRRQERIQAARKELVDVIGDFKGDPNLPPQILAAWVECKEAER